MRNAAFSLDLQTKEVGFSDKVWVQKFENKKEIFKRYTFIMDMWSSQTTVQGISVQEF